MSKSKPEQFSFKIKSFCDAMDQAVKDYNFNYDKVNELDRLTQDYLHMMELGKLNYKERAVLATKLQNIRKQRRKHKDSCEILQPLIDFLNSDKNKNIINLFRGMQGQVNKVENRLSASRTYRPRVISMTEFDETTGRKNGTDV